MVNNDKKHLKNIGKKQFKRQSAVTKKARSAFTIKATVTTVKSQKLNLVGGNSLI